MQGFEFTKINRLLRKYAEDTYWYGEKTGAYGYPDPESHRKVMAELVQILEEEKPTTKSQFDLFMENVSKMEFRLLPWQKNIARRIYREPIGAGKSTLIALLYTADKKAREYYESGFWQNAV